MPWQLGNAHMTTEAKTRVVDMNFREIKQLCRWRSTGVLLGAAGLILCLGATAARAGEANGTKTPAFRLVSLEQMVPVDPHELGAVRGKQLSGSAQARDPSAVAVILWDETRSTRYPPSVSTNTAATGSVSNTLSTAGGYGH